MGILIFCNNCIIFFHIRKLKREPNASDSYWQWKHFSILVPKCYINKKTFNGYVCKIVYFKSSPSVPAVRHYFWCRFLLSRKGFTWDTGRRITIQKWKIKSILKDLTLKSFHYAIQFKKCKSFFSLYRVWPYVIWLFCLKRKALKNLFYKKCYNFFWEKSKQKQITFKLAVLKSAN